MSQIQTLYQLLSLLELYEQTLLGSILFVLLAIIGLGLMRLYFLRHSRNTAFTTTVNGKPKVSIHLPICNEPPGLVLQTIQSVVELNYENFELLVISNNTEDPKLWKPIESKLRELGEKFKFIHLKKLKGYKAGALNYALDLTCPNAEYIFTLDSDYTLDPEALEIALGTIQKLNLDILQFPQAYRNISPETSGLEINYKHYFDCYLSSSKSSLLALPTGTLTLIKRKVFKGGLKWPTDSITEDASLGVDLIKRKLKTGFCNCNIGKGTMPTETIDYETQFKRWVFGNFQVLIKVWKSNGISLKNKFHLSTLLTAWLNLLGLIFIILILALPLLFTNQKNVVLIYYLGFGGIFMHCFFQLCILRKIAARNFSKIWSGFLIHLSSIEIGAFYWMSYVISSKKPFLRTNKFLSKITKNEHRLNVFPISLFLVGILSFLLSYYIIALLLFLLGFQITYSKFHITREIFWSKINLSKIQTK
ncbi:Glycosyltransferase, catalytic subunit of cellulose synthase and poly-beta-1,6-N-acetylglucosamine synthase [Salegentibacter echinorum]|uniref:Beta-monoglucosyldiacylglycerol synthase n=1 Tax=Salegentibacter echinorum TaxID=1073325 RepID=A0A1M5KEF9_SALEC|nr:glycosyltransferase [Salegentibacter echinorum]SHG50553.1 Glycosyltransferase, catalytic subunit of cellulose synthase and poly-beta-1,6-N-acetylglucosamine synthase [Salegentibacter echinorum]